MGSKNEYQENWYESMRFELRSYVFRKLKRDTPNLSEGQNYLNLGSGSKLIPGAVNADFFISRRARKKVTLPEWELDLRYQLNCSDKVFDGVFSSHVLEHLYPSEARQLLSELHRIMKPGAKIRLVVPNLEIYADFYCGRLPEASKREFERKFPRPAMAIRSLTQKYYHRMVWDYEEMNYFLSEAGFKNVMRRKFGDSADSKLVHDLDARDWESLYVEAEK